MATVIPSVSSSSSSVSNSNSSVTVNIIGGVDESPPQIWRVETFREDTFHQGELVYIRLYYTDPDNDAIGFGFHGINGSGWAPEQHPFINPGSYARVSPGQVEIPFNLLSGTPSAYNSEVAAYIYDDAGNRSPEVDIHLFG